MNEKSVAGPETFASILFASAVEHGVPDPVFELRAPGTRRGTISGYFNDPVGLARSAIELELLVDAWHDGKDRSGDPLVRDMVREEVRRIHRAFEELTRVIAVHFTERDPYTSFEHMVADVHGNRRMLVFTGASVTPLWDPETNWKARAVHDWDHIQHMADFSAEGEIDIYRATAARVPGLAPLYLSEIVLQAAVQTLTGQFEEQKLVLPPGQLLKKIPSLGQAERATGQPAALLVWYAATILRFSDHAGVMAHLAARGVPLPAALAITDAAAMLSERRL